MDHMFIMRLAALLFGGGIAGCLFPGKSRMSHILFLLLILAETIKYKYSKLFGHYATVSCEHEA